MCCTAAATAPDCIAASGCVFPFEYYGVEYSACTTIGEGGTGTSACWCSTTSTMVPDSGNWKYCSAGCNPAAVVRGDDMSTFDFSAAYNVDASTVYDGDYSNAIDTSNKQLIVAVRLSATCVSSSLAILFHVAESCSHASVPFGWGRKAEKGRVDEAGLGLGSRLLHLQRRLTKLTPVHVAFNMTKGMRSILPSATTPYTAPRANTRPPKILSPKLATDDASMISVCPRNNASNIVKQPNRLKHNSAVTCMVS